MNSFFKKKQVVISTMVLALGVAVFMNWYFAGDAELKASQTLDTAKNLGDAQYVNVPTQSYIDTSLSSDPLTQTSTSEQQQQNTDYFTQAKLNRQIARDESIDVLQKLIDDTSIPEQSKIEAVSKIALIAANVKMENDIENLVMAKGFSNCVVVISDESIQVVVQCEKLLETQVVQIKEIVLKQGDFSAENISVIEVK